jgi:RNA polymerase sigma-70 factor (ECF subfamily)
MAEQPANDRQAMLADLEPYRAYLQLLARMQLPAKIRGKLDASDLVQQSLLQACQAFDQYRGVHEAQRAAWLRQILARTLAHALRDLHRVKRDIGRERSLEMALEASSAQLESWLADDASSPSQKAQRNEQLGRLAAALKALPEAQCEAVTMHYFQNQSLDEIGQALGRSRAAVAGLLQRGLRQLRTVLDQR